MSARTSSERELVKRWLSCLYTVLLGGPPHHTVALPPKSVPAFAAGWNRLQATWPGHHISMNLLVRATPSAASSDPLLAEWTLMEAMARHPLSSTVLLRPHRAPPLPREGSTSLAAHGERGTVLAMVCAEAGDLPWLPCPRWEEGTLRIQLPCPAPGDRLLTLATPHPALLCCGRDQAPVSLSVDTEGRLHARPRLTLQHDTPSPAHTGRSVLKLPVRCAASSDHAFIKLQPIETPTLSSGAEDRPCAVDIRVHGTALQFRRLQRAERSTANATLIPSPGGAPASLPNSLFQRASSEG